MPTDATEPAHPASHWTLDDFHSADPAMQSCLELARAAARTDLPVLIAGESGTGKTLLARTIHNSSARRDHAFVSFNAAALSDTLLDSQLFGHERGAFTGAHRTVKGKFELADGGTLFIDEIGDMSLAAQVKILHSVEYGEFERLGSEKSRVASVRLLTATRFPLQRLMDAGRFRDDLFYRLNGIVVTIPPLRERPTDLRALIAAEVECAAREQHKRVTSLSTEAFERLCAYPWPGNLRELNRVVRVAVALSPGEVITPDAVRLDGAEHGRNGTSPGASMPPVLAATPAADEDLSLRSAERAHILRVLALVGGNKRRAARVLDISRSTLDRKLS